MLNTFPLIARHPDHPVAFLTKPIESAGLAGGVISARTFLAHVNAVAAALEHGQYAINLCENRYLFLVSFCAAIVRGHTNLLPPNKNVSTQEQLSNEYTDSYVIHDGCDVFAEGNSINLLSVPVFVDEQHPFNVPAINNDHLACISFTSGSTGRSKPNLKYWRTLHRSTAINFAFMIPPSSNTVFQLATMPAQHMWGLETSALMALFHNVCTSDAKPLFPADIMDILATMPEPRALISTPVHLRALSGSVNTAMPLHVVLCATSPLTTQLARDIEQQFSTALHEVYGCSEVGSMAVRRTATEQAWRRFDGIDFTHDAGSTTVTADHLPSPTVLQDVIIPAGDHHFTLAGRATDLVKIAGKRGSLFEINQTLLGFEGLNDGIMLFPESTNAVPRLCAIVSLKDGVHKSSLIQYLQQNLDNAFVPRPVYVVDELPRETNGKLLKAKLDALYFSLKSRPKK